MTMTTETEPRVWIGCLACYNAGRLTGQWVDAIYAAGITEADIHREMIDARAAVATDGTVFVVADGPYPHEELWCMDHEGFSGALSGECSPSEAQSIAEILAEVDDHERDAFAAWWGNENRGTLDSGAVDDFRDHFHGVWDSPEDYARDFASDTGAFSGYSREGRYGNPETVDLESEWPFSCIDWESATRELMTDYTVIALPDHSGYAIFHD
jgi:antirestriction protein